jgi:anti-sigma factor RsiW
MAPVPAACSALADQVAALEAEERSLRAALANLSGFAAWATLVKLSRVQDDLDNRFRPALRDCIELGPLADRLFPGELLVMDGNCVDSSAGRAHRRDRPDGGLTAGESSDNRRRWCR